MAHKKGGGSTGNGRDSNSQRLGVKIYGGEQIRTGQIIIRQHGTHFKVGNNVRLGGDYTIYSLVDGVVKFEVRHGRRVVNVYPEATA